MCMAHWGERTLQDANSPIIEEFLYFHDFTMVNLAGILTLVGLILGHALVQKRINKSLLDGQVIETIWTVIPGIVLLNIAVPSLLLLYRLDEIINCGITVKTQGHQWYWSYEYSDFWGSAQIVEFDSYMEKNNASLTRLLDVDNRIVVPYSTAVRVLISSADVLHSWTVPRLGVKADACPGRLNQVGFIANRPGVFYGQCSEICGANHRFIPIVVEASNGESFLQWLSAS